MIARTRRARLTRLLVLAAATIIVALVTLVALARWDRVPPAIANSALGAPFVRLFNGLRERRYFARDADCLAALAAAGVDFAAVAAPRHRDPCPLRNVVRVRAPGVLRRPLYMTCRLARALRRFEQTVVQPAADRRFHQPVAKLVENGVRNCRTVDGYDALLSEHAFANAIDVEGFVLRDGTVVAVRDDAGRPAEHAAFVREISAGACGVFRTVLGPGFDERHGAHLHLDMGLLGGCRP